MLLTNTRLATTATEGPYGLIEDGAIIVDGDRIAWVGEASALPANLANHRPTDLVGRLVTPALIDCHTHIVGFCEGLAFTVGEIEQVFERAKELELPVKLRAEQLSNLGGSTICSSKH